MQPGDQIHHAHTRTIADLLVFPGKLQGLLRANLHAEPAERATRKIDEIELGAIIIRRLGLKALDLDHSARTGAHTFAASHAMMRAGLRKLLQFDMPPMGLGQRQLLARILNRGHRFEHVAQGHGQTGGQAPGSGKKINEVGFKCIYHFKLNSFYALLL